MSETLDRAALAAMFAANLRAYAHSFRSAPGADLQQGPDLLICRRHPPASIRSSPSPLAGTELERCAAESTAFFAGRARAYTWVMDAAGAAGKAASHEVISATALSTSPSRPSRCFLCIVFSNNRGPSIWKSSRSRP
jgi:hypothetical protein